MKGLQRKLARQIKGSKGWYATRELIQREYEKITNRRKDKANKVFHDIAEGQEVLVIQDDNIRGWQKGLFGKQVQNRQAGAEFMPRDAEIEIQGGSENCRDKQMVPIYGCMSDMRAQA